MRRYLPAFPVALAAVGAASSATADNAPVPVRQACIAASEEGQVSRHSGRLRAARASFLSCSKPECPETVRVDCSGWLEEVDKTLPTVVVRAVDGRGADITDGRVWFDHEMLLDRLGGSAVAVDPGEHQFMLKLPTGQTVEQRVVIREGEKARPVLLQLPPAAGQAASTPERAEPRATGANVAVGSVFGAIALASLGTAIYFETQQASLATKLQAECPHGCPSAEVGSQVSAGKTDQIVEGALFGVAGATLAVSAYMLLAKPFRSVEPASRPLGQLDPEVWAHGGGARWTVAF